ncbi:MAG: hypothetical protein M1819_002068 [Sarea resinae]|nr:MAG: hypothetical protein M1819_002068 [Sarea resinae]
MASAVQNARIRQWFEFCCGYDPSDWKGFLGLFRGFRRAVKRDEDLSWDEWKKVALQRYQNDRHLQRLRFQESVLST